MYSFVFCQNSTLLLCDQWLRSAVYHLRRFARTAVILTPAREASRFGTALHQRDPLDLVDPVDPEQLSFLIEFETPIEVECSKIGI